METDKVLRKQLLSLLKGGHAHMSFDQAVADFPAAHFNDRLPHVPYTFWHLLEHIRIAQWDILEFVRNPKHTSPPWPEGYWPNRDAEADSARWKKTIESFRADLNAILSMVEDPDTDLYAPLPHAKDYNVLREVLLVADHNAYHIGEFAALRGVMDAWPDGRKA